MLSIQRSIMNFGLLEGLGIYIKIKRKKARLIRSKKIAHPVHLRKESSDHSIFKQIFIRNEYDLDILKNIQIDNILDLGANIGLASVFFKNYLGSNPNIIAVEPHAGNVEQIRKNLKPYSRYQILPYAIWDKKTTLKIVDNNNGYCGFEVKEDQNGDVQSVSIKDIMVQFNIPHFDIVKMDIEGSEKTILSNGVNHWLPKAKVVFVELHDRLVPGCTEALNRVKQRYNFGHLRHGEFDILINPNLA